MSETGDVGICSSALLCALGPGEDPRALRLRAGDTGFHRPTRKAPPSRPASTPPGSRAASSAGIRGGAGVQAQQPLTPALAPPREVCVPEAWVFLGVLGTKQPPCAQVHRPEFAESGVTSPVFPAAQLSRSPLPFFVTHTSSS